MDIAAKPGGAAGAPVADSEPASELIDKRIAELADWRGQTLARMRALIHEADPDVVEESKWMGTPVWSHAGILCTGETYKSVVKLTFAKGASLEDPSGLFNSSLDGKVRRALDIHEGEAVDAKAFKALIRAAVEFNLSGGGKGSPRKPRRSAPAAETSAEAALDAYIARMTPWQAAIARVIDTLVATHVPGARRAVRWNSPMYGLQGQGWFLAFRGFQRHLKLSFFKGALLSPAPPIGKFRDVRSLDVREADALDESQLASWIRQAASIPGWDGGSPRLYGGSPL